MILYYKHLLDRTGNKKEVPKKITASATYLFYFMHSWCNAIAYT